VQAVWSLVIWWPIGGALLLAPAALLLETRRRWTLIAGELAIALAGVFSVVLVYRTDDAQAGIGLIYPPILGCAMVGVLRGIEWVSGSSASRQLGRDRGEPACLERPTRQPHRSPLRRARGSKQSPSVPPVPSQSSRRLRRLFVPGRSVAFGHRRETGFTAR